MFIGMLVDGTDMSDMTGMSNVGARIHEDFDIDVGALLTTSSPTAWMEPMMDAEWMKVPARNTAKMIESKASPSLKNTGKKKKKGPRFKYVYDSPEQAAEARRQRNREAALRSYRQKREYLARMEAEVAKLESEHAELLKLLDDVTTWVVVDIEGIPDVERHLTAKQCRSTPGAASCGQSEPCV